MKKICKKIFDIFLTAIALPFVFILLFLLVLYTPIDYLRYKKTFYYKQIKEKYTWLCGGSTYIKVYDLVQKNKLPIDFYRNKAVSTTGYGWFKFQDCLLLVDYNICYDEELCEWVVNFGDDEPAPLESVAVGEIDAFNTKFGKNIEKAVVLIDEEIYNDIVKYYFSDIVFLKIENEKYLPALKDFLNVKNKGV
jgi:hypothetical protein